MGPGYSGKSAMEVGESLGEYEDYLEGDSAWFARQNALERDADSYGSDCDAE